MDNHNSLTKFIGSIPLNDGEWQIELSLVERSDGCEAFELRKCKIDHSTYGEGISFSRKEFEQLKQLINQECNNRKNDVTELITDDELLSCEIDADSNVNLSVQDLLHSSGLEFVDNRNKGGALWVIGGKDIETILGTFNSKGYYFIYSSKGGKATHHQPGWFLK